MRRPTNATALFFTQSERRALQALRGRYWEGCDLFTSREQAHLLFLRWLYRTGYFSRSAGGGTGSIPTEVAA